MFDLIGDVHGCIDELQTLLARLGNDANRKIIFVGDLIDRGPDSVAVLNLVMEMVDAGRADCTTGNHDDKLRRYLKGSKITPGHGLAETIEQLEKQPRKFRDKVSRFLEKLPYQLILDNGKLHVSHAGLPEKLQGADNGKVRSHCLYGDVDGTKDERGYPVRKDWAANYKGSRIVVHGHVPVREVTIKNNVWDIDTGACFGNKLTALRYPEMQLVEVPSIKNYQPFHPFP